MSVLKMFSEKDSFIEFSKTTKIPVFSVYNKGDRRNQSLIYKKNRISFDVSEVGWNNLDKQQAEAIAFLEKYFNELLAMTSRFEIDQKYLSFPSLLRINDNIVNQNTYFSSYLLEMASKLKLGLEVSIYDGRYLAKTKKDDFKKLRNMHDKNE